ncbi:MAG: Gldg family protein [Dyella sp.]
MHRRALLRAGLILLPLVFVALVLSSSRAMRSQRLDLTEDQLYTLTPGTVSIVETLRKPLRLTLYFSDHAARDLPQLRSYEQRVSEMLQEMAARAHGKIRLRIVDPLPYSDDEASAESYGLTSVDTGSNGAQLFFGLVGSDQPAADADADAPVPSKALSIPLFDPSRETFLEYDIAKLVYELNQPSKPHIGVISSLPVDGNPAVGEAPWAVMRQLSQLFDVKMIDPAALKQIGADIKVLLLIHPKHLSDDAQYALDQYVLRGGHLVVLVDPDSELDNTPYVNSLGVLDDHNSDLPRLFAQWGVRYDPQKVVLDRSRALQIELYGNSFSHPAMLGLGPQEINREDVITASLQRVNVSSAGYFDLSPDTSSRLLPLLQSTPDAQVVPAQQVRLSTADPSVLLNGYKPDNTRYVIAARLRGSFSSAFPERADQPGHLAQAKAPTDVVLVADTDLLSDRLWLYTQNFLGQSQLSVIANNGDFVTHIADNLSGSSALLSIRGRSTSQRPFTKVRALQAAADQKFLAKKRELEGELADTQRRLAELQSAKTGAVGGGASAEQKAELEKFVQRRLAITKELRDVQHQLNAEIDALGLRLKFINILLVPALLALIGLLYGWRRSRFHRRRR